MIPPKMVIYPLGEQTMYEDIAEMHENTQTAKWINMEIIMIDFLYFNNANINPILFSVLSM